MKTDVLIIGSGSAGLSTAINIASRFKDLSITIVTKSKPAESNTKYAQGGIAAVLDGNEQAIEKHIQDTLVAGDGLCNQEVVEFVVRNASHHLNQMIDFGARFDKEQSGLYSFGREGGHSQNIILHSKDTTGAEVQRTLLDKARKFEQITILDHHFSLDLITEHHFSKTQADTKQEPIKGKALKCYGIYALDQKNANIIRLLSKVTVLASGGVGQVYQNTTNPTIATGDGIAMAYRAKADVTDMEFVQFHPTALYAPNDNPTFLISEAVRGEGAILRTQSGDRFMTKYDARLELASRDIVARAIDNELKQLGEKFVWLDCRLIPDFDQKFPSIFAGCMKKGINPLKEEIPVVPAAHYICGGVEVDQQGRTSVDNLYACGECSKTGLHGANRLASNSLLEAIVFAGVVSDHISETILDVKVVESTKVDEWNAKGTTEPKELILISHNMEEVKAIMNNFVGIVRSDQRLKRAFKRMHLLYEETEQLYKDSVISPQLCELRNLISVGYLIIKQSMQRVENKGGFYNSDLDIK